MSEKKTPGHGPVYVHDEPAKNDEADFDAAEAFDAIDTDTDVEHTEKPEASEAGANVDPAELEALNAELETLRSEADQYKDQFVRSRAELENVRKRAERDIESARKFALDKFAADLLGVRDSLELGLQAAEEHSGDFEKLLEGMEMTQKMLVKSMEKFGVEIIQAEGETFNPEMHEAMTMQPTDEHPPNTVVSVLQKGYSLNGRVLRPAMVVVSKAAE